MTILGPQCLRLFWKGGPCNPEGRSDSEDQKMSRKGLSKAVLKTVNQKDPSPWRPLVGGPYCSFEAPKNLWRPPPKEAPQERLRLQLYFQRSTQEVKVKVRSNRVTRSKCCMSILCTCFDRLFVTQNSMVTFISKFGPRKGQCQVKLGQIGSNFQIH